MKTLNERTNDAIAWIDAQLAICKASTDGPWIDSENYLIGGWWVQDAVTKKNESSIADFCFEPNAAFIAASRTGYPAMLELMKVSVEVLDEFCGALTPRLEREYALMKLDEILIKIESLKCE
jgi:hypothetical protein